MSGGSVCSVASCTNTYQKSKRLGQQMKFFSFPKSLEIREEWIRRCCRNKDFTTVDKRICSIHFKAKDYEDRLQAELLKIPPKKLKKTAVPTLHLHPSVKERRIKKKAKERLKDLTVHVAQSEHKTCSMDEISNVSSATPNATDYDFLLSQLTFVTKENEKLVLKIEDYKENEVALRTKLCEIEHEPKQANCSCNQIKIALNKSSTKIISQNRNCEEQYILYVQ